MKPSGMARALLGSGVVPKDAPHWVLLGIWQDNAGECRTMSLLFLFHPFHFVAKQAAIISNNKTKKKKKEKSQKMKKKNHESFPKLQ